MTDAMVTLSGVLVATAEAHSPRALVRAIAAALAQRMAIDRVELDQPPAVAVWSAGAWRCEEPSGPAAGTRRIATGLAVVPIAELPAFCGDAAFRVALGHVVAAAARHLAVVQRVATLSRRAHRENRELRADLERLDPDGPHGPHEPIIARSPAMRATMQRVALVARHPTTVLLIGESGTGKEVLARELHRRSPRGHRPLVQLNCGALPEALVESELFGHERGAFTGADRVHVGAFERAQHGTLLLDEVGELPPSAQVKLLRVLQERQIRRVGGEAQIDVDVRLIAATNRSLAALVQEGQFREDLYYRLDVFAIQLPALRERRGDLGPLVAALSRAHALKLGTEVPSISRAVLTRLEAHDWPGNVRELMNVLETAMILGGEDGLALPDDFPRRSRRGAARVDGATALASAVRIAIEDALRATRGRIYGVGGAAARLGLKPGTLQSKMKKLGIERTQFVERRSA